MFLAAREARPKAVRLSKTKKYSIKGSPQRNQTQKLHAHSATHPSAG